MFVPQKPNPSRFRLSLIRDQAEGSSTECPSLRVKEVRGVRGSRTLGSSFDLNKLAETIINGLTDEEKGAILAHSIVTIRSKMNPQGEKNLKGASLTMARVLLAESSTELESSQQQKLAEAVISKIAEKTGIDKYKLAIHETIPVIIENLATSLQELELPEEMITKVKEELWNKLSDEEKGAVRAVLIEKTLSHP